MRLRAAGITRVVLVTGDRADIADIVGRIVGRGHRAGRLRPRRQARRDPDRERASGDDHGRRRGQRRAGARRRRRRRGARCARRHRVLRGRRRRAHRRPARRAGRRHPHRAPLQADRPAGRARRHGAVAGGDGRRRGRACSRRQRARCCRRSSTSWPSGSRCGPSSPARSHVAMARRRRRGPAAGSEHDAALAVVEQIRTCADALSTRDCRPGSDARPAGTAGSRTAAARAGRRGPARPDGRPSARRHRRRPRQ